MNGLLIEWSRDVWNESERTRPDPSEHLLAFSAAEARMATVTESEFDGFLRALHLAACRRFRGPGMFYAWYDELADQFRASVSSETRLSSLPFRCALEQSSAGNVFRQALTESRTRLSWDELRVDDSRAESEDDDPFVLRVVAWPLLTPIEGAET